MPPEESGPRHFADRLAAAVRRSGTPAMVGIDPRWEMLPESLRGDGDDTDAETRAAAYRRFARGLIDVVAPLVGIVKPQAAFFEQLGVPGMQALADCIAYARAAELLVLLDAKRGDIGSTAAAYADGLLGTEGGGLQADALTVNPYLGHDSLDPFVGTARQRDCGLFVLVKTSNPGGGQFQDLEAKGKPVYMHIAEHVEQLSVQSAGECGYGLVGAVVGATYPEQLSMLRGVLMHCWLLVPGFGSQGGAARDVAGAFDLNGLGAVINNSRNIIFAHRREPFADRFGEANWQQAVEAATREMIDQLRSETPAGRLGTE